MRVKLSKISRIFITHIRTRSHIRFTRVVVRDFRVSFGNVQTKRRKKEEKAGTKVLEAAFKDQEPLVITGPPGLKAFVHAAMTYSRTQLGTDIIVTELTTPSRKSLRSATGRLADDHG